MTRADVLRRTLSDPAVEARRKAAAAAGNGRKLLKFCPKRGYAVPPDKLAEYRFLLKKKGVPARDVVTILGIGTS